MNKELIKKFKEGDWVIRKDETTQPEKWRKYSDNYKLFKLWKPKKGEWCWFWNYPFLDLSKPTPVFGQFNEYFKGFGFDFKTVEDEYYKYCEPFIGKLPTVLEETKRRSK